MATKKTAPTAALVDQTPERQAELTALLMEWREAVAAAMAVKPTIEREQELRKRVFAEFFQKPEEGVNVYQLPAGYQLKGTHKIERKVDGDAWPAVKSKLIEMEVAMVENLVNWEPKLDTKYYKSLCEVKPEAAKVMDEALTIKPGSPTLEFIAPRAATIDPQGQENL